MIDLDLRPLGCLQFVVGAAIGVALWHLVAWLLQHVRVEWVS